MDMKKIDSPPMKAALQNELMILKLLSGSNTIGLIDHYQTANNMYIIQPFCNGGDFRSYLNKNKKVKEEDALRILKDLLLGMQELYNNSLTHRDIKPENTFINNNCFKIADYGFSTKIGHNE
jgi:serine/threonine protein kinase